MISPSILVQINGLLDKHCKGCITYRQIVQDKNYYTANRFCLDRCWVQKKVQSLIESNERSERKFSSEERFYLYHHIEVLGRDRGVKQVARKLESSDLAVECEYDDIRAKRKSTRNMAV